MLRRILKVLCVISFVLLGYISLTIVCAPFDYGTGTSGNGWTLLPNTELAVFALAVLVALSLTVQQMKTRCNLGSFDWENIYLCASIIVPLCLLVLQAVVYFEAGITTGWDAGGVEDAALLSRVDLGRNEYFTEYFSHNQNLLFTLRVLRYANTARGLLYPPMDGKDALALVACCASSISCFLFMRVAVRLFKNALTAGGATLLFVCLVGLCPWFMIPYTDVLTLPFCMAMLWCSVCGTSDWTRFGLLGLCAAVGFAIKPTVIFGFVAIALTGCLALTSLPPLKAVVRYVGLTLGGLALGGALTAAMTATLPLSLNEESQLTAWHYAMMGLNNQTNGEYSEDDVEYSTSFATVEERNEMNRLAISQRLEEMGVDGLVDLLYRKLLFMYNSGTFCWGGEGNFVVTRKEWDDPISRFLVQTIYEDGNDYRSYYTVQQSLWMFVLIGMPLGLFGIRTCGKRLRHVAAMLASIIMLTVFLLIFEVRARYLFLYSGYYVLLAAWGYECLWRVVPKRWLWSPSPQSR